MVERAAKADIVFTNKVVIDEKAMDLLPNLKYIGVMATGYNVVDIEAAASHGITVTNIPAYSTNSVAQMVFAHLLNIVNRVDHYASLNRNGRWSSSPDFCYWDTPLHELAGKTFGVVGLGNIGMKVARLAHEFGMDVYAMTSKNAADLPDFVYKTTLEGLLGACDIISLHCPLTSTTKEMFNKNTIGKMRKGAILINTGRGPLVNEADVADAVDGTVNSEADWLTYAAGKVHAKANETGAPRTGVITVGDVKFTVTQIEPKDFKGTYTFTTKVFAGAVASYHPKAQDPKSWDVTIGEPRKAVTLTDADGETKHTNNVGIKGLYFDAIMDACIEIDYENQKAKMGVFYDARPEEAQKIAAEGDAKGLYARFVPTLVTRTAAAWAKPWKFDEVNLGNPNYAWAWFPLQADLKTFMYYNRAGNNVEFSILSQYANTTMNQIAGIDVVATATADGTPSTYSNVYQVNAKGKPGTSFVRK